jgi:cytochrome c7-like protein
VSAPQENSTDQTVGRWPGPGMLSRLLLLSVFGLAIFVLFEGSARTISKSYLSNAQEQGLDYSKFLHSSQKHASLSCTSCHTRSGDNSATPAFPGHKACTGCHLGQFVSAGSPMCSICHTDVSSKNPPMKAFPVNFKESFNVKFDHGQHMSGSGRPEKGCQGCHDRLLNRGVAISVPARLVAHSQCYVCHTPNSKSSAGREMASCGVCHERRTFVRTSLNARSYRAGFSHSDHGARQRLDCNSCHSLIAGGSQQGQLTSPRPAQHFLSGGMGCLSCHNGKRVFGGDLAFKECKRCHTGQTFRTPV